MSYQNGFWDEYFCVFPLFFFKKKKDNRIKLHCQTKINIIFVNGH